MDLQLTIDGVPAADSPLRAQPLIRAVVISLFSWRRANPDDELPGADRGGWWADAYAPVQGDLIGSRWWLLARSSLTGQTVLDLIAYGREALQWLVDDGVADAVDIDAVRNGIDRIDATVRITQASGSVIALRFDNVWSYIRAI